MGEFKRGLSNKFMVALAKLAQKSGWWQDVLADASLIIGIRDEELDVYWNGQSLFHAEFDGKRVNVNTHIKYLLDPDRSDRPALNEDGTFQVVRTPMLESYAPGTLSKLKRAADLFSVMEKQGVHAIAQANENIIDVEIMLDATGLGLDIKRKHPRIDIAAFEQRSDGVELVFWEAKLFANKELRALEPSLPKVVGQIEEYKLVLGERKKEVLDSYQLVANNLVGIAKMNGSVRQVGPAIRAVASGVEELRMSIPANVGLVIFGFDDDQKTEGGIGHKHFEKLIGKLGARSVRACGKADGLKLFLGDEERAAGAGQR